SPPQPGARRTPDRIERRRGARSDRSCDRRSRAHELLDARGGRSARLRTLERLQGLVARQPTLEQLQQIGEPRRDDQDAYLITARLKQEVAVWRGGLRPRERAR